MTMGMIDHDHHDHHHHAHHHAQGEACDHIVDARQLAGPFSWRKVMAVVFSVGIRPCTGAILVLVFAVTQGLFWAGVAATFAMAFGTAITVAVLATLALGSRELALKLGGTNAPGPMWSGPPAASAARWSSSCSGRCCFSPRWARPGRSECAALRSTSRLRKSAHSLAGRARMMFLSAGIDCTSPAPHPTYRLVAGSKVQRIHRHWPRRSMMTLQLGETAPDFEAETTQGHIRFHEWLGNSWAVLFSHPKDFTPVCTTELGYMAKIKPEFDKRGVKIIGLSVDPVDRHAKWAEDIKETQGFAPNFR